MSQPGAAVIKSGAANLQRGRETVGGKLKLTTESLIFTPHGLNFQTSPETIPLSRVEGLFLAWTKFLDLIPLFPNSLAVHTADGVEHRFVLFGRKAWKSAIEQAVAARLPLQ